MNFLQLFKYLNLLRRQRHRAVQRLDSETYPILSLLINTTSMASRLFADGNFECDTSSNNYDISIFLYIINTLWCSPPYRRNVGGSAHFVTSYQRCSPNLRTCWWLTKDAALTYVLCDLLPKMQPSSGRLRSTTEARLATCVPFTMHNLSQSPSPKIWQSHCTKQN
jgi:hypothetical protein